LGNHTDNKNCRDGQIKLSERRCQANARNRHPPKYHA
jgi:hypothetical protein